MADSMKTHDLLGTIMDDIKEEEAAVKEETEKNAAPEEETEVTEDVEEEKEEDVEEEEEEEVSTDEEESSDEEEEEDEEEESEDDEESEEKELDKSEKDDTIEIDEKAEIHEIVVDGMTKKVSIEDLKRDSQKVLSADKKFKEASTMRKDNEVFWEKLLENPGEAIVDRITDEFCKGDRVKARSMVVESILEWLAPEREAAQIEDEKERNLFERERELTLRTRQTEREAEQAEVAQEREADAEFDRNLRSELAKAFKEYSLPEDRTAIWQRTGKLLQEFSDELPSSIQGDVEAMREEIVKNSRAVVAQVAKERNDTKDALKSTLSTDDLADMYPELREALKKTKIDKVKKKRSKKKSGVAKKQQKEVEKKREEIGSIRKPISTREAFDFDD